MIKISSLEFLNSKVFESDVMASDGSILFYSGDKVTPEIILKLYFKDIYVNELPWEEDLEEKAKPEIPDSIFVSKFEDENLAETAKEENDVTLVELSGASKDSIGVNVATSNVIEGVLGKSETEAVEEIELVSSDISKEKIQEESTEEEQIAAVVDEIEELSTEAEEITQTPILTEPQEIKEEETTIEITVAPEPVAAETSTSSVVTKTRSKHSKSPSVANNVLEEEPQVEVKEEIKPEDMPLSFDEELANRIVANSIKIGKILKYSPKELQELEQVAYYCNIGISKFKRADLEKSNFYKMKIYASYEYLIKNETISADLAEIVKHCGSNYDSNAFPLDSKIPFFHIVAITSYYEDLLMKNNSKTSTLNKMLQIGGNKFNIFILHKFIRMMREENE